MSILTTCCCCVSIRKGSFSVGLFTLIYYTIVVAIGAFHVHEGTHSTVLLALSFVIVLLSGLCVAASIFLLVGISVECRQMFLPWIIIISTTTLLDIIYTILWLCETFPKRRERLEKADYYENHTLIVLIVDIIMCAFNIYGIICVISQYQIYGQETVSTSYPSTHKNLLPPIEFRLIQIQNSKLNPKSDIETKTCESIVENNCLKVPKLYDSSSGSSAVEDISDGSLLTTIDETKIDFKNSYSESRSDNDNEFILSSNSNKLFNHNRNNFLRYNTCINNI